MENTEPQKTVLETITEKYDKIFQAEKKVADYILRNPDVAVQSNVSELANHSGVSDATVVRFCKHLGYDGYYQMRLFLSRDVGRRNVPAKPVGKDNASIYGIYKNIADGILAAGAEADEKVFREIIDLIRSSTMVHLVAVGNSSNLCMYFGPRLERLGIRCTYNTLAEHYLGHISLAPATDLVLAVSGSGTSRYVVKALELARERGLKTVAITGYRHSPVSRIADHLLLSGSGKYAENHITQSSRLGEMVVMEVLTHALEYAMSLEGCITQPEMLLSETKF